MNRLKELRNEFDFSIRDFEELLGLGRNVIYYIEKGTSDIDTEKVALFCKLFQVSSDYFNVLNNEGIYVKYLNNTYSLTRDNFLKYKELGFIKYENKKRLLVLPDGYDIDFVHGNIKLIEVKPKKN